MYRGIIQEKDWVGQGSYLRGVVQQYQLDKNYGRGRIWRLVHPGFKPGPQPHMLNEPAAKLVTYLDHPNGWWRDTAQKLLVLGGDKSVAPTLVDMARSSTNQLARLHALWTLEGLDALEPSLVLEKLKDPDPHLRMAAIRASETLYKKGDHSMVAAISALAEDPDPNVVVQVMLTASYLKWPDWGNLVSTTTASNLAYGVKRMGAQMSPPAQPPPSAPRAPGVLPQPAPPRFTVSEKQILDRGQIIYQQLCFACHGMDGKGTPLGGAAPGTTLAPPLSGSKTATGYRDGIIDVVLKGLSGPVDGKTYTAQMIPMESNDDAWVAAIISYIRNNFNNHSTFITSNDVARVRAAITNHTNTWTIAELRDSLPQPLPNRQQWKLTASHNGALLRLAVDGSLATHYDTRVPQTPGMWVQIELPQPTEISGVELDAGTAYNNYPRGYKIELSDDGAKWGAPVATGRATASRNQILFPPETAKFIRITQTGSDRAFTWSIAELQVLKLLTPDDLLVPPEVAAVPNGGAGAPAEMMPVERTPFTVE
jgi:mono/diheme cytochrome c family protein